MQMITNNPSKSSFVIFTLAFFLLIIQSAWAQKIDLAITGANLIDGTSAPLKESTTILVCDGQIEAVASDNNLEVPEHARVIVAGGEYVLPGFADMHVHCGSGGFKSAPLDRILRRYLFYGVTTIFNVGGSNGETSLIQDLRSKVASCEMMAPRIYATGNHLTIPGSHPVGTILHLPPDADSASYDWSRHGIDVVKTNSEAQEAVQAKAKAGMDAIKIMVESGPPPFGDDHPQMPPEMISVVVKEASSHDLPVVAHVSTLDKLEDAVENGVHAIMHAVERAPLPGSKHWNRMRSRDIFYVPTLSLYSRLMTDRWTHQGARKDPFLQSGITTRILKSLDEWEPATASMPDAKKDRLWKNLWNHRARQTSRSADHG